MSQAALRIDLLELLQFFDHAVDAQPHASSVKGIFGEELGLALLVHYFQSLGDDAKILKLKCNKGRRGHRLDGWVNRTSRENGSVVHYQVEVKAWSIHGFGGNKSPFPSDPAKQRAHREDVWLRHYWNAETISFRPRALSKVLEQMNPPGESADVEPLACIWDAVHPAGEPTPFFQAPLTKQGVFQHVCVFSMSNYVRQLCAEGKTCVDLELPLTAERLRWIHRMIQRAD